MVRISYVNAKNNVSKMIGKLLFSRKNQLITGLVVFLLLANPVNIAIILSEAASDPFDSIISIQERNENDPDLQNPKIDEENTGTSFTTENSNSIEDDNLSWTLISDGLGFENSIRQEYPKFVDSFLTPLRNHSRSSWGASDQEG